MTSLRVGLLGLLLFLALARKGSAQQIVCSRESNCDESFMEVSVESCCVMEGVRTYRPSPDAEQCIFCFAYGWVHEIAPPDNQSAVAQPNINAAEGDTVSLTIYFVQNGPSNTDGFIFTIETGGTAQLGVDYQLVHADPLTLVGTPMAVTVTLLSDGVAGEGSETIILTLIQSPGTPSNQNQILQYGTVMITVADSDFETGFRVSELTVAEGERTDLCLRTSGMPASDIITVTLTEGSAEENDVSVNGQVTITAADPEPCVVFTALADSLALEGQEMLTLSLSGPDNVIFRNSTVRIFINDGDVVIFEFDDPDKASKEASGVINVTVSQNIATAAPIDLTVTPTEFMDFSMSPYDPANPNNATPGVDFSTDVVTVTIPPGNGGAIFPIVIFDDKIQENSEQHFVGVLSFSGDSTGAALGSRTTIRLNIEDDDSLIVRFAELSHNASEGNTDVVYNLVITKSLESEQIYNVALRGTSNTASEGEDYSISSEVYLFPAEDENITVPVIITGDRRIELREDFFVTLRRQGGPPFVVDLTARQTTINIVDNDGNYMYVPAESTYFVMEGTTTEVSFVLLNPPAVGDGFEFDFNVIMSSGDGEATAGSDYVQISDTISATSSTNGTITVNVTVLDDAVVELAEAFFITGQVVGENIPVVFDGRLEISITSDDVAVIGYVQPEYSVLEGETVDVCLSPLAQELEGTITVALSAVAGSATEGEDFETEDRFITFGPNMMLTAGSGVDSESDNTTEMACITVVTARDILSENDETLFIVTEIMTNAELAEFQSSNTTTVTILDGTVLIGFEQVSYTTSETEGSVDVCVTVRNGVLNSNLSVFIDLLTSTATEGEDFEFSSVPSVINIESGMNRGCLTIAIISSAVFEGREEINLAINATTTMAAVVDGTTTVVISSDGVVTLEFSSASYQFIEGDTLNLVVQKSRPLDSAITFNVLSDGLSIDETRTFEAGVNAPAAITISVITVNDVIALEPDKVNTVTLTLVTPNPQIVLGISQATVTEIDDDNMVTIGFVVILDRVVTERDGTIEVGVRLEQEVAVPVTVDIRAVNGTALEGEDYIVPGPSTFTFSAAGTQVYPVAIVNDRGVEPVEEFTLILSNPQPAAVVLDPGSLTISITDDDVILQFTEGIYQTSEEAGFVTVCAEVGSGNLLEEITANVTTRDISARAGMDYVAGFFSITIAPSSAPVCVNITILSDNLIEDAENFFLRLTSSAEVISASGLSFVSIAGETAMIGFEQVSYTTSEEEGSVDVCVTVRNGILTFNLSVLIDLLPSTATEGEDFEFSSVPPVILIESGTNRGCLTITIISSPVIEGREEINLAINTTTVAAVVDGMTTVVISTDGVVTLGFSSASYQFTEGKTLNLVVQKSRPLDSAITFNVLSDGLSIDETRTFEAGVDAPAAITISIITVNDVIALEPDKVNTVTLTLVTPNPRIELGISQATVTEIDDDIMVTIGFVVILDRVITESDGTIEVDVRLEQEVAVPVTVDIRAVNGTALEGEDYIVTGLSTLTFSAAGTQAYPVAIVDDRQVEFSEEFTLILSNPQPAAVVLDPGSFIISIVDNDVILQFTEGIYPTSEETGFVIVCAEVGSGNLLKEIAATVTTNDITAEAGMDYVGGSFPITIAPMFAPVCVNISILSDTLVEDVERFSLRLTSDAQVVSAFGFSVVSIAGETGMIGFEQPDYRTSEMVGSVDVCVTVRNGILTFNLSVLIDLLPSTATEGEDFEFSSVPPVIVIESGTNRGCLAITIISSAVIEGQEEINLAINTTTVAAVVDGTTTVVISSDGNITVGFARAAYQFTEGETINLVVQKSAPLDSPIAFRVSSDDGLEPPQTVTFEAGVDAPDMITVSYILLDDVIGLEPDQVFTVNLDVVTTNPQIVFSIRQATVTIMDGETPVTIRFDRMDITVSERDDPEIFVTLVQDVAVPVTVDIRAVSGTAVERQDYFVTGLSSFTFSAAGRQRFPVSIVDDVLFEGNESFTVVLSNPRPDAVMFSPGTITVTIIDNDVEVTELPPLVNNTIVGDPFYTAPVSIAPDDLGFALNTIISLCYEVHGEAGRIFNLVNDFCTLVNAHYVQPFPGVDINVIDSVAIQAIDTANVCHKIEMNVAGCSVSVDGVPLTMMYDSNGITVRRYSNRVRVSVPNCEKTVVVMWMVCESGALPDPVTRVDRPTELIKFVVARGLSLTQFAHGLLGQFWNVPITVADYTGRLGSLDPGDRTFYLTISPPSGNTRTFVGVLQERSWDKTRVPCIYVGNRQAGPIGDIPEDEVPNDSVIEGQYLSYIVSSKYANDCVFCQQFNSTMCAV